MSYIKNNDLDESKIQSSAILQERDGKLVKRFWLKNQESLIFKKTREGNIEKEKLIRNSSIPTPKMFETKNDCIIFEDLGEIKHPYECGYLESIIDLLIQIHQLPISIAKKDDPPRFPSINHTFHLLVENHCLFSKAFDNIGESELFRKIEEVLLRHTKNLNPLKVLSHGDFHVENIAVASEQLYVLDWEFMCINDCYDDLFCLLDITIPYYERVVSIEAKKGALTKYFHGMNLHHLSFDRFYGEYLLYAMLYLFQIIFFIENDKVSQKHSLEQLNRQFENTVMNLKSCYNEYNSLCLADV